MEKYRYKPLSPLALGLSFSIVLGLSTLIYLWILFFTLPQKITVSFLLKQTAFSVIQGFLAGIFIGYFYNLFTQKFHEG